MAPGIRQTSEEMASRSQSSLTDRVTSKAGEIVGAVGQRLAKAEDPEVLQAKEDTVRNAEAVLEKKKQEFSVAGQSYVGMVKTGADVLLQGANVLAKKADAVIEGKRQGWGKEDEQLDQEEEATEIEPSTLGKKAARKAKKVAAAAAAFAENDSLVNDSELNKGISQQLTEKAGELKDFAVEKFTELTAKRKASEGPAEEGIEENEESEHPLGHMAARKAKKAALVAKNQEAELVEPETEAQRPSAEARKKMAWTPKKVQQRQPGMISNLYSFVMSYVHLFSSFFTNAASNEARQETLAAEEARFEDRKENFALGNTFTQKLYSGVGVLWHGGLFWTGRVGNYILNRFSYGGASTTNKQKKH